MYAVIETGGKQYRVQPGDIIEVERAEGLIPAKGKKVAFDKVLAVRDGDTFSVGEPSLDTAKVSGEFLGEVRGPKLLVFKKKRRKGYRRTRGHRQDLIRIRIDKIQAS